MPAGILGPAMTSRPTYRDACRAFRWEESARALGWAPGEPVNLGHTIVDRHAGGGRPALRWLGKRGEDRTYSFDELGELTARFAAVLRAQGVEPGDRVAGFLPRVPEMLIAMIGTWKAGAVYVPIFTGFGPDAVEYRVRHSGARVLVTHREHRARLPEPVPPGVTVVTVAGGDAGAPGDTDFWRAMDRQPGRRRIGGLPARRARGAPLHLGLDRAAERREDRRQLPVGDPPAPVHGADLRRDDIFWPTGDPGWGYGLVCYMGALALGVPVLSLEAAPTPELCVAQLRDRRVSNLATTPTLLRGVMALGPTRWPASACARPAAAGSP